MAVKAKDGTPFTNPAQARLHDRKNAQANRPGQVNVPKVAKDSAHEGSTMSNDENETNQQESPEEVVAAHGPAKQVLVKHDGEKHTVKSRHDDGHEHTSTHESAEEAHDTAKSLAGVGEVDNGHEDMDDLGSTDSVLGSLMGK